MARSSFEAHEFEEFVRSYKEASNRSRYILYIALVACVMMMAATLNIRPNGWAPATVAAWKAGAAKDTALTRKFVETAVERLMFVQVPALGITMSVNDLGLVGGIALAFIMLLLVMAVAREHENLYLLLQKAITLCREDPEERNNPHGKANLLYHSAAMTQLLNEPPTMARWRGTGSAVCSMFVGLLFLFPALIQAFIASTNLVMYQAIQNRPFAPKVNVAVQVILAIVIAVFGLVAWIYSSACATRWRHTFFAINPDWKTRPQRPLHDWLKISILDHPWQRMRLAFGPIDRSASHDTVAEERIVTTRPFVRLQLADELLRSLRRRALAEGRELHALRNAVMTDVREEGNGVWFGSATAEAIPPGGKPVPAVTPQPEMPAPG